MSGAVLSSRRVASMPDIRGRLRSITTTSGTRVRDERQGVLAVLRLADDANALLLEQLAKPAPEQIVVIDHQGADRAVRPDRAVPHHQATLDRSRECALPLRPAYSRSRPFAARAAPAHIPGASGRGP